MLILKRHGLVMAGVLVGSVGGFLYWKWVGCISGTCPITSNSTNSTIYGAVIGGWVISIFEKKQNK